MSTFSTYYFQNTGVQVLTPPPTSTGGKPINMNFLTLATQRSTSDPSPMDDSTHGYLVGCRWINTDTNSEFVCLSNGTGTANWQNIAAIYHDTSTNLASVVLQVGQLALATDTGKVAIGDGSTTFANLAGLGGLSNVFLMFGTSVQFGTGGLTRGSGAVDLQSSRSTTSQVASGNGSFVVGKDNTASGAYSHAEGYDTIASGFSSHSEGNDTTASGNYSHAEGQSATAHGRASHAEGFSTVAGGYFSHAEGGATDASGFFSHAEGNGGTTSGYCSHVEGFHTSASGQYGAHAEGKHGTGSGYSSHAEGTFTTASGYSAHAEGYKSTASASSSNASGSFSIAAKPSQHAQAGGSYDNSTQGLGQVTTTTLIVATTNATQTEMTIDGNSPSGSSEPTSNRFLIVSGKSYAITVSVSGKQQSSSNIFMGKYAATIVNISGTITLSSAQNLITAINPGSWGGVVLQVNSSPGSLQVMVTGAASTNIRWAAVIEAVEITY